MGDAESGIRKQKSLQENEDNQNKEGARRGSKSIKVGSGKGD